ncbi:MAG: chemotaxis protein CheW [Fimbriimonadaceae bacterium]|nr:chemotaxis protein CheW [Fimbriimonadaceae bacterium]
MEQKFVVFQLGKERYGIAIEDVERILQEQKATPLPGMPPGFAGVFELRGETIPVLKLADRLGLVSMGEPDRRSLVVVQSSWGRCAWLVDKVEGIISLEDGEIEDGPEMVRGGEDDRVKGLGRTGDRLVVLLHPDQALAPSALAAAA